MRCGRGEQAGVGHRTDEKGPVPVFLRRIVALGREGERVVYQVVDPSEVAGSFLDEGFAILLVFQVSDPCPHGMSGRGHFLGEGDRVFIQIGDADRAAFADEFIDHAAANAVHATGHEGDLAGKATEVGEGGGSGNAVISHGSGEVKLFFDPRDRAGGGTVPAFEVQGEPHEGESLG